MTVLIGRKAPDFDVAAVRPGGEIVNSFKLSNIIEDDHYGLIFFYPLDFTFVCPSELIALNRRIDKFEQRKVNVVGVSIDSQFTHHAWINTPINEGGIGHINFTLLADVAHNITQSYGVEHPDEGVALRAAFILDKQGIVRSQLVNDLPIGRNIDELVRVIDALQFHEEHGEVCPAGWHKGDTGMTPSPDGVVTYLSKNADNL